MSELDYSSKEMRTPEILDRFRSENDRLERLVTDLGNVLQPVLMNQALVAAEQPMEEPYHDYHNMVLRLTRLNEHLGNIIQSIKL